MLSLAFAMNDTQPLPGIGKVVGKSNYYQHNHTMQHGRVTYIARLLWHHALTNQKTRERYPSATCLVLVVRFAPELLGMLHTLLVKLQRQARIKLRIGNE
jgi:hypothetical protein